MLDGCWCFPAFQPPGNDSRFSLLAVYLVYDWWIISSFTMTTKTAVLSQDRVTACWLRRLLHQEQLSLRCSHPDGMSLKNEKGSGKLRCLTQYRYVQIQCVIYLLVIFLSLPFLSWAQSNTSSPSPPSLLPPQNEPVRWVLRWRERTWSNTIHRVYNSVRTRIWVWKLEPLPSLQLWY